ncbi:hypothetical protein [Bacillus sp. 1P06AnD]|uniref:hypothetical protein n=1 Tax=Bacillus sp. 1P06AnD TaxID=3132208 RepID=UPI00399F9A51
MTRKFTFLLPLLLIISLPTDSAYTFDLKEKLLFLERSTIRTLDNFNLHHFFSNPKVIINNQTIYIEIDMDSQISNADTIEQFMRFKVLTKRLRFILKNHPNNDGNALSNKDIVVYGRADSNTYVYTSKLPYKELIQLPESYLSINSNTVFSTTEFKRVITQQLSGTYIEKVNGHDDTDIHKYARRIFNVMTNNGKYYNPRIDDKLIIDAVCSKFNITFEQYSKIDNKYYLFPTLTEE